MFKKEYELLSYIQTDLEQEGYQYHFEPFVVGVVSGDVLIRIEDDRYLVVLLAGLDEIPVGLCTRSEILTILKARNRWQNTKTTQRR
jgi:hypothetical protein